MFSKRRGVKIIHLMQEAADGRGAGWYDSASPGHDHFSNLLAIKLEIEDTFTEMSERSLLSELQRKSTRIQVV